MKSKSNYLKHWRTVKFYIKAKYELSEAELELILFLYSEGYFTKELAMQGALFPNPARDRITVLFESEDELQLSIFDMLGRRIFTIPALFDDVNQLSVDVTSLSQGLYFVTMQDASRIVFNKLLIKD